MMVMATTNLRNMREQAKINRDIVYEEIRRIEKENKMVYESVTHKEILDACVKKGLKKRSIRRYLKYLCDYDRIYKLGRNQYISDVIYEFKKIFDNQEINFVDKIDNWNLISFKKNWDEYIRVEKEYEDIKYIDISHQIEQWFSQNLKIYLSTDKFNNGIPPAILGEIIELIKSISYSITLKHLFNMDDDITLILSFSPSPFKIDKNDVMR